MALLPYWKSINETAGITFTNDVLNPALERCTSVRCVNQEEQAVVGIWFETQPH
jgi:hypothetical protein